jgi:uncharacterized cupredoxin-like copper-binding protein
MRELRVNLRKGMLPVVVAVGLAVALTACSEKKKDDPAVVASGGSSSAAATTAPPAEVNAVKIDALDYGYNVGGTVKSGLTKITFANTGKDFHMLEMAKLKDGKTAADALAALTSDAEADDKATFVDPEATIDGKPSILTPGASTTSYAKLEKGAYALICFFPMPDGKTSHFQKGMVAALTVTDEETAMTEPATQGEVVTDDKKLTVPDFSSGKGTYKYTNNGSGTHALLIVQLHDGKTYEDFITWADKYFTGQAKLADRPAETWGGIEATKKSAFLELNLPPGKYVVLDTESPEDKAEEEGGEYFRDAQGGLRAEFTVA